MLNISVEVRNELVKNQPSGLVQLWVVITDPGSAQAFRTIPWAFFPVFDTHSYISSILKFTAVLQNSLQKKFQVEKWWGQWGINHKVSLEENNPDRISKCVAWEAKFCHLHLQPWHSEFLRCCEIPFQSRAQGYWFGKERKSYMKHLWPLKFCWQQCHTTSLVEEVNPLEKRLHNLVLRLRHVLPTGYLHRHLAEPRNDHSSDGNLYAKQSSKTCLKNIHTNSNKGQLSLLWERGRGGKDQKDYLNGLTKSHLVELFLSASYFLFWLERAKNKY